VTEVEVARLEAVAAEAETEMEAERARQEEEADTQEEDVEMQGSEEEGEEEEKEVDVEVEPEQDEVEGEEEGEEEGKEQEEEVKDAPRGGKDKKAKKPRGKVKREWEALRWRVKGIMRKEEKVKKEREEVKKERVELEKEKEAWEKEREAKEKAGAEGSHDDEEEKEKDDLAFRMREQDGSVEYERDDMMKEDEGTVAMEVAGGGIVWRAERMEEAWRRNDWEEVTNRMHRQMAALQLAMSGHHVTSATADGGRAEARMAFVCRQNGRCMRCHYPGDRGL
jgi:hypothetical protein